MLASRAAIPREPQASLYLSLFHLSLPLELQRKGGWCVKVNGSNCLLNPLSALWKASNPFAFLKRVKNQVPLMTLPGWTQLLSSESGLKAGWGVLWSVKAALPLECRWASGKCPESFMVSTPKAYRCPTQCTSELHLMLKWFKRNYLWRKTCLWFPGYQDNMAIRSSAAYHWSSKLWKHSFLFKTNSQYFRHFSG